MASIVNSVQFKKALSYFPTGITIIATSYNNQLFGLTVNSFTSVSLLPPLILFCINKQSTSIEAFNHSQYFTVSILSDKQIAISKHFAHPKFNKFTNILYHLGENSNCPLIDGAVCHIECSKFNHYDGGDHLIMIGEVINTRINDKLNPLIYYLKQYRELK